MVFLLITNCNVFKAYYSLSRLCRENGFKKINKEDLPVQMGNFKIVAVDVDNKI